MRKLFVSICILAMASCAQSDGWQINASGPTSPLQLTQAGRTVDVLADLGPVFDGWAQGPGEYAVNLDAVTYSDGYTHLHCTAGSGQGAQSYTLSFKPLAAQTMEMLVAGPADAVTGFNCGTIQGDSPSFKQFYTGQRYIEVLPGNHRYPPVLYWPAADIFIHGYWDADYSFAKQPNHRLNPKNVFSVSNPPATCDSEYAVLTDGAIPALRERYVFRFDADLWQVYQPNTNSASAYGQELAGMVHFDHWGKAGFAMGQFTLDWLEDATAGRVGFMTLCHGWNALGFDVSSPDYFWAPDYDEPHPDYGSKSGLLDYIGQGNAAGRMGLHVNYMLAGDDSYSLQEGLVERALAADGTDAWYLNMLGADLEDLVQRQESEIQQDLGPTASFIDQLASGTVINYDAAEPEAGRISAARRRARELAAQTKAIHNGPVLSESLAMEHLLGAYVDSGDYGIKAGDQRYDFTPEYKLRQLHHLGTFYGMGLGYRFFYGSWEEDWIENGSRDYFEDDDKLDSYRCCEVLYGNGAYLYSADYERFGMRLVHALTECFTVGVAQTHYLLQPVDTVQYGRAGQWKSLAEIVKAESSLSGVRDWFEQFHVRYQNGCHVWVNRAATTLTVTTTDQRSFDLPQYGWLIYTEDGNLTVYTALTGTPARKVDFCEDVQRQIKYVNPRQSGGYMGVNVPTVWLNGQVHFELSEPDKRFLTAYRDWRTRHPAGTQPGEIITYFDPGLQDIWGMDCSGLTVKELHLLSYFGKVYRYRVSDLYDVRGGQTAVCDNEEAMFGSALQAQTALALLPTYVGPYGKLYYGVNGDRACYRSIWGHPEGNDPGAMAWGMINGYHSIYSSADITPDDRGDLNAGFWTAYSNGAEHAVYRYPSTPWIDADGYLQKIVVEKAIDAVSLGNDGDLWMLCADDEVLHLRISDGVILARFELDDDIADPYTIAYDQQGKLWVADSVTDYVYLVAAEPGAEMSYLSSDLNRDHYVNLADFALFVTQWLNCNDRSNPNCGF